MELKSVKKRKAIQMNSSIKVRFGIDIDGVIYRFADTANYLFKTHWGYDLGEWDNWDYPQKIVSPEAWKWLWSEGITKHGLFRYGSIYKGAREFLTNAAKISDIVVITSRPPLATLDTMQWLAYQQFPTNEVHIVRERSGQKKSDIVPHCDIYLDDGPHNIEDYYEKTDATILLIDRPWNQEKEFDSAILGGFTRVKTFDEVYKYLEREKTWKENQV